MQCLLFAIRMENSCHSEAITVTALTSHKWHNAAMELILGGIRRLSLARDYRMLILVAKCEESFVLQQMWVQRYLAVCQKYTSQSRDFQFGLLAEDATHGRLIYDLCCDQHSWSDITHFLPLSRGSNQYLIFLVAKKLEK